MKKHDLNPAKGVVWNLDNLYKGINDPQIKKDIDKIDKATEKFIGSYKGEIKSGDLTADQLLIILIEYEEILEKLYVLGSYSGLLEAKDNRSDKINKFYSHQQEFATVIQNQLMFFELELIKIPDAKVNKYLADKKLADYHQFIIRTRIFTNHTLEEDQEVLINKKSQTGSRAFVRLYDQLSAELKFPMKEQGKVKNYNYSEIINILSTHKDRKRREDAAKSITQTYKDNSKTFGFILNTLLLDKKVTDEIRRFKYPQHTTFLSDEIDKEIVKTMTGTIENNYEISEKFYITKSKITGNKLHEWDRYSTIYPDIDEPTYTYQEAKETILKAFEDFSPVFAEIASKFFDSDWIDAELSESKKSGAFCSYTVPSKHPVILTNYTGKANDVRTLAHELGHGIHAYLSREQNLLNYWPVTPFAEIASIFCETIVFNKIYGEVTDTKQKVNMLGGRIQEIFATIFRQNAFYLFESDIHKHRREEGELSTEEFNSYFQSRLQETFGKGLELTDGHKYWWAPVAHFYHYNFYVFSYAFGQSLTNALYGAYKNDGDDFIKKYIEVLSLGSSKKLPELTALLGVDIHRKEFWKEGLDVISDYVKEFEELK